VKQLQVLVQLVLEQLLDSFLVQVPLLVEQQFLVEVALLQVEVVLQELLVVQLFLVV